MKTEEDEAFEAIERRQGGFQAKRKMAADKLQEPAQEPIATRPCRSCGGTGQQYTGIDEAPTSICKPCDGTGQIALAQPAQEPVAYVTGMSFGRFIVEPLNPAMVLPVGMALYSASQGNT